MSEIQDVIDGLVAVQGEIFTPADEKPIAKRWDEPPTEAIVYPCFVNVESEGIHVQINGANRQINRIIEMQLLFAVASQKYSVRSRRKWEEAVLQAFGKRLHLIDCPQVNHARIEEISYEPIEMNGSMHIGVTFMLNVEVRDCFEASVNGPTGEYSYEYSAEYPRGVAA